MYSLIFLAFSSLLFVLAFTPPCKKLAWRFGIVDHPDQARKLHSGPIPRLGGVAIFAAVLCAYGLLLLLRLSSGHIIWEDLPLILRILPSLLIVFALGLADDIYNLHPWVKLAVEVGAAVLVWFGGIQVSGIAGHQFSPPLGFLISIVWVVGCTNAVNLIDGMDGLAAGVSFFAALTMAVAALIDHNYSMALVAVPLAGALIGFLRYNFNPATIFLGDCGSLALGFLLACCGAVWSEKATTLLGMTAPLLALAVPLLDTGLAVARRFINNQRIFGADHAHIHHKLLSQGLTPRRVVLVIYTVCAFATVASLLLAANHNRYRGVVILLVCLAVWNGLQRLGYNEFGVVRRAVLGGTFRNALSAQLAVDAFERELQREMTLEQCYELLCKTYPRFGFSGLTLQLDGIRQRYGAGAGWQARIEFSGRGYINLWRTPTGSNKDASAALFIDCVFRVIDQKLEKNVMANLKLERITIEPDRQSLQNLETLPLKQASHER